MGDLVFERAVVGDRVGDRCGDRCCGAKGVAVPKRARMGVVARGQQRLQMRCEFGVRGGGVQQCQAEPGGRAAGTLDGGPQVVGVAVRGDAVPRGQFEPLALCRVGGAGFGPPSAEGDAALCVQEIGFGAGGGGGLDLGVGAVEGRARLG